MQAKAVGVLLILAMSMICSSAFAEILYFDDGGTVTSNWSLSGTTTLTSDGDVLNLKGASSGDYAILNFDSSNGMTLVFDFKITNPGSFFGTYVCNPSEGVWGNSDRNIYSSYDRISLGTLSADTWYTVAIYSLGNGNYTYSQSVYVAEGKSVDMTGQSPVYSYTTPYAYGSLVSDHAVFYAYTDADLKFDNIRINAGLDLTSGVPVALVETPTFSPGSEVLYEPQNVTISCATEGATIRYTTDNTEPSETNGTVIASGSVVLVSPSTVLKAKAWASGYDPSLTMSANYSAPPAEGLFYDDCSTVSSNWSATDCTLESDGETLRQQTTAVSSSATLDFGFTAPVDEMTMVFDFMVHNPGELVAAYPYSPGEGVKIVPWWSAYASFDSTSFQNIKPDTWYTIAIYNYGTYGYQAMWIAEGKQANLWTTSRAYQISAWTWTGSNRAIFYAYANEWVSGRELADWEFDNISVNAGFDLTCGAPLSSIAKPTFSLAGGFLTGPQNVTISCATEGVTIRYTTDGTDPTKTNGTVIASGASFLVNPPMTLKARAWGDGSVPSSITTATYVTYNRPASISAGEVVVDGNLSDWSDATWAPLDKTYNGTPSDITEAAYAAKWQADKIYVAVRVNDAAHYFTDNYGTWNGRDAVEIYLNTNNSGDATYPNCEIAQQYTIGFTTSGSSLWTALMNGSMSTPFYVTDESVIKVRGSINGNWLYYEAEITPYTTLGLVSGATTVPATLKGNEVIGLDVCAIGNNAGTYTGMVSENSMTGKSADWKAFGLHALKLIPGDANLDGSVDVGDLGILAANYGGSGKTWAQGDFNGDGIVDVGDLGILAANYGTGTKAGADFDADYTKVFGTESEAASSEDTTDSSICGSLGLSLIAGLGLMGLMLVKLDE